MSSSCCGGNCGRGSGCNCESGCGGCKMSPDISVSGETTNSETMNMGVAPQKRCFEASEMVGEDKSCKCDPCKCDPCNCGPHK